MIKILGEIIKDSRLGNKVIYFNKSKRVIPSPPKRQKGKKPTVDNSKKQVK